MSFRKVSALVLALLIIFTPVYYSFATVNVLFDVYDDGTNVTVTGTVYSSVYDEPAGDTVSFNVYGTQSYIAGFEKIAGNTYNTTDGGFYYYILESFSFPLPTDGNYYISAFSGGQMIGDISNPGMEVQPQVGGTIYQPDGINTYNSSCKVVVFSEASFIADTFIQPDGTYALGGIPQGTYFIVARPEGIGYCESEPAQIIIDASGLCISPQSGVADLTLRNAQFTGSVVNPIGEPNGEGNHIEIYDAAGNFVKEVFNDANGQFAVCGLMDGNYMLRAITPGDSLYGNSNEVYITITGSMLDGNAPILTLSERAAPQISGIVYIPGGSTPYNAGGRVEIKAGYNYFGDAQIMEDGTYSIGGLSDGTYEISAIPNSLDYCRSNPVVITITGGALSNPTEPVNLVLQPIQFIAYVFGPDGVTPFTEGFVDINREYEHLYNMQIGQGGLVAFGGLGDGTYYLQARPYDETGDIGKSNNVEIVITGGQLSYPSGEINITMQLNQFAGSVIDPNGIAVGNTNVEISDEYGKHIGSAYVSSEGIFKVGGLSDGYYKIYANAPNGSIYAASAEVQFQIQSGALVGSSPVLVLSEPQLIGTVVGPQNETVQYGFVEVKGVDVNYGKGEPTSESGVFKLAGLPDGRYLLRGVYWNSPFSPSEEVEIAIVGGKYTAPEGGLVLRLTAPQIIGSVYLPDGVTKAQYSWVEVSDSMGKYFNGAQVNENGLFNLGGLPDGTYVLRANPNWESKEYTASQGYEVVVSGGVYSGGEVSLILSEPQLRGSVQDPNGNIVNYGYIEVQNEFGEWFPGVSIQNGAFALGSLKDGIYTIKAMPDMSEYGASNKYTFKIQSGALVVYGDYTGQPVVLTLQQAQITGTVLDSQGNPVKGGWVEVRSPIAKSGEYFGGTGVDYNGQFKIAGLQDGDYVLVAWPNDNTINTSSQEVGITISAGSYSNPPEGGLLLRLGKPQIVGEVIAPNGIPEANGHVEVMRADGTHVTGCGVDHMGNFTIGGLKDGTYYLKAYPGYGSEYSASMETVIKIVSGEYSGGILSIKLTSAQLMGSVYEPDGTTPVMNAWVSVDKITGENVSGAQVQNGVFKVGSLKPGTYKMRAYPDWIEEYGQSNAITFTIGSDGQYSGEPIILNMSSPQITGYVKGPSGSADAENTMAFGFVEIKSGDMHIGGTGVDHNGKFKISGLNQGTYTLTAMPGGENTYSPSLEVTIEIDSSGNYVGNAPLVINLTTAQITGVVRKPEGEIAKFGFCEVFRENGEWVGGSPVNQNGEFAIGNLEDGTYTLRVHPDYMESSNYSSSQPLPVVIEGGLCTTNGGILEVALTGVQLTGTVVKPGDSADTANHGWVEIQKDSGSGNWIWEGGAGIDWQGQFNIGGLTDGTYRLKAYPDWMDASYSPSLYIDVVVSGGIVTTVAGLPYEGNVTLSLSQSQISGVIAGPNGETVEYGWVDITDSQGNFVTGIGAKQDGSFSIGQLEDGTYTIKAFPGWKSQFTPSQSQTITISGGSFVEEMLVLNLENVQVTGTVVDPVGNAVDWGWVEVYDSQDQWIASTGIDETGCFRLSGLVDGSYKVQAFPATGSLFAASLKLSIVITDGTMTSPASLELELMNPKATGIVHRPDGTPVKGGWIEIGDANEVWLITVPISKEGTFNLPELETGEYSIQSFPREGSSYVSSGVQYFTVSEDGSYSLEGLDLDFTN